MKQIFLTQDKQTIVDDSDFERLNQFKWHAVYQSGNWYAKRQELGKTHATRKQIFMHREILNVSVDIETDHINGDGLDNRRNNLRAATTQQNQMNQHKQSGTSSVYKGVHWRKADKGWCAQIYKDGQRKHIGIFPTERSAALAYDMAAKDLFGQFARLNFPL